MRQTHLTLTDTFPRLNRQRPASKEGCFSFCCVNPSETGGGRGAGQSFHRLSHVVPLQDFCSSDPPFIPANLSRSVSGVSRPVFVPLVNSTALGWASAVGAPAAWPPVSSLRLLASLEDQSCVDACRSHALVCEPAHFRFINNKEALRGYVSPTGSDRMTSVLSGPPAPPKVTQVT